MEPGSTHRNASSFGGGRPERPHTTFRLSRHFSLTSLLGLAVVTVCLLWSYRDMTKRHLVEHEQRANANLTQALANAIWTGYRDHVIGSGGRSRQALLDDPATGHLRAELLTRMKGLPVVKIKIYSLDGTTVFSTDDKQLGESKRDNAGFQAAKAGQIASAITFRERFDSFEGVINNRDLIASYLPVRTSSDGAIEGVIEIYSDVTDMLRQQQRAQWQVAAIVLGLLGLLYVFLSGVVRKADRLIQRQASERAAREDEVRHQAYHDALTGLPNRAYFTERLSETLSLSARHQRVCALMFVDLDRFKFVNDSLGHAAGDRLLQVVSQRIQACLRDSDLLFRVGGDEFTVLLPQIAAAEDADLVARRIADAMARPAEVSGHELTVGASIGIGVFPGDGSTAQELLKNADAAMYAAKNAGRGTHAFYSASMNRRSQQRLDLEMALSRGFRAGEFVLHYQPRVDPASRTVLAVEALLRWESPERGLVLPGEFIGVLEESGMMGLVGEWVLRTACTQVVAWAAQGHSSLRVSVNVSSIQFQDPSFVATVQRVLKETGAEPSAVELELTESILVAHAEQASANLKVLRALGLRIALDDFGCGYSSLNYLRHLAVDYLKIDRSFVDDIIGSPHDQAVAKAIIELAQSLGISVVAEGVETEAQARFFTDACCHELQGFLFSKAVGAKELERLLPQPSPDVA